MKQILIIDDKSHALHQVCWSIGSARLPYLTLIHVDSVAALRRNKWIRPSIVFLDFFLDRDGIYGTELLGEIESDVLIGFSSHKTSTKHIEDAAIRTGRWPPERVFSVWKDKSALENIELKNIVDSVLPTFHLPGKTLARAGETQEAEVRASFDFTLRPESWIQTSNKQLFKDTFPDYTYAEPYMTWWIHRVYKLLHGIEQPII